MKKYIAFALLAALVVFAVLHAPRKAYAAEYNIGTITSADGGSFNNTTTATTFKLPPSHKIVFSCTAAVYYNWTSVPTGTVSSSTGLPVLINTQQNTSSGIRLVYLNIIPQSASVMSCYVFDAANW